MIPAYDMDGVLATGPRPSLISWRRMNGLQRKQHKESLLHAYYLAKPILTPKEPQFSVISARKDSPEVRRITEEWLDRNYPGRVKALHLLSDSRNLENVVEFKAGVLATEGYTDFTEDNQKVVAGLVSFKLKCRIWLFIHGKLILKSVT